MSTEKNLSRENPNSNGWLFWLWAGMAGVTVCIITAVIHLKSYKKDRHSKQEAESLRVVYSDKQ